MASVLILMLVGVGARLYLDVTRSGWRNGADLEEVHYSLSIRYKGEYV